MNAIDLRTEIERNLQAEDWTSAYGALQQLWASQPSGSFASFVLSCAKKLRSHIAVKPYRVFALRSFTVEPVLTSLAASAFVAGIDLTARAGDFNAYAQEILDPASVLYSFAPDAALLCIQTRDIAPQLWNHFADLPAEEVGQIVSHTIGEFAAWFEAFRKNSQAHLIVHLLEKPAVPSQGIYDAQGENGQYAAIDEINAGIRRAAKNFTGIRLLDYDALVARHGRVAWHDEVKWRVSRLPLAAQHIPDLAHEWLRFVCTLSGQVCKVLVTDLDNTLWGGIAGEDGLEGVKLGAEHPGFSYVQVQRAMLDLYRRGILLAVASKNNPADAMRILESHGEMLLRPDHFASLRINWNNKVQSIREIAQELNLGLDSIAFFDDNPAERQQVRLALPEVKVIELPDKAAAFAQVLRDAPYFERLALTDDDRRRNEQYREQRLRTELEQNASSIEDYYRALRQTVEVASANDLTIARIAQLTAKTNQFNLTTRRYSEQQIRDFSNRGDWNVYAIRVTDRFGDNGLVGVLITQDRGDECHVDTFLLSCRVIGRTVERAILSFLVEECRRRGLNRIVGQFIPTKKNEPAANFYVRHGFEQTGTEGPNSLWTLELRDQTVTTPDWITLIVEHSAATEYAAS